jgi:hypothetical protein
MSKPLDLKEGDVLVHKKGGIYRVLLTGVTHSETLGTEIVYQNTSDNSRWSRPEWMFTDDRFRHINHAGDWLS